MKKIFQIASTCFCMVVLLSAVESKAQTEQAGVKGPSSSILPYLLTSVSGAKFTAILTAGDDIGGYKMAGTPDGVGAYDNNDGTFTMLVNHEFTSDKGAVRAHGSTGSFVSKWIINKSDFTVVSGSDLIRNVKLWNVTAAGYDTYNATTPSALTAFGRYCSADLPEVSAFYNATSGNGTTARIFMNGEETGFEGRAFAHIATGDNAGTTYELPALGKFAWENSVAHPATGDKTIVAGMDDGTGGQVYFYYGTKTSTGSEIEKAGLTNGKLYGVAVNSLFFEVSPTIPAANTAFSLIEIGNVTNTTGAALDAASNSAGITTFLRPEDGAWDPSNPNDFYFNTTNSFKDPSRLWRLRFKDVTNPEMGGTITAVLDGTEGQKMLDNLTIDKFGHAIVLEDVGNEAHIGKVWQYSIATDELKLLGAHDPAKFLPTTPSGASFLTQDEETSGILDVQDILGRGMFLLVDQAHFATTVPGIVEGGQLLAFYNPDTYYSLGIKFNNFNTTIGGTTDLSTLFTSNSTGAGVTFSVEGSAATLAGNNLTGVKSGMVTVTGTVAAANGFASESKKIVVNVTANVISSVNVFESASFTLYPNPVNDGVLNFSSPVSGSIFNANGAEVKSLINASQISVAGLLKGIYFVKTLANESRIFVIE